MRLISLHLVNFRLHADTFINFELGLTGIVGTNGAGKSTILEGISFALYGTIAARGNKDSIRFRRGGAKATVRVELVFELAGHRHRVVRGLSMAEYYLDAGESPVANSLSGVSENLTRVLGMTRQEFFRTYFTQQKDLAAMATLSAPDRAKFLSRALGFDKIASAQQLATERRKAIVAEITGVRLMLPDLDRVSVDLARETEAVEQIGQLARVARVDADMAGDALALLKPRWESAQQTRDRDTALAAELRVIDEQLASLQRDWARLSDECVAFDAAHKERAPLLVLLEGLPALRVELKTLDAIAADNVSQQQAKGRVEALDEQLARNSVQLESVADCRAAQDSAAEAAKRATESDIAAMSHLSKVGTAWHEQKIAAKSELAALRQQHTEATEHRAQLLAKGADGACAACGKPLGESWQSALVQADADIATLLQRGTLKKAQSAALETMPADVAEANAEKIRTADAVRTADAAMHAAHAKVREFERLESEMVGLRKQRTTEQSKLDAVTTPYDAARHITVRAEIDTLAVHDKRVAELNTTLSRETTARAELATTEGKQVVATSQRTKLQSERDAIGFSEANFTALRADIEKATATARETENAAMSRENQLQRSVQAKQFAEREIERSHEAREKLDALDKDRLCHEALERAFTDLRTELNARLRPELAEIASGLLHVLTDGRYSEADFDEEYTLRLMRDGESQQVISGGEEDLCNLVLRLALSQMIAARAGHAFSLLILDEVFGSMDETRRNNVVELLRALNDRFEQVIVITHIDVSRSLDHIITVTYDEDLDCSEVTTGEEAAGRASRDAELMAAA